MEQDTVIKICVAGEPSVGKTSMLYQYVDHKFDQKIRPTIACDYMTKLKTSVDGKPVRLQLWDISGKQKKFNAILKMYLRGALGCIIICSSNDQSTLEQAIKWKKYIQQNSDYAEYGSKAKIPCLLVQNKSDLINNQHPESYQTKKHLEEVSRTHEFCGSMQCSAKENKNIEQIFQTLLDEAVKPGFVKDSDKDIQPVFDKEQTIVNNSIEQGYEKKYEKNCVE